MNYIQTLLRPRHILVAVFGLFIGIQFVPVWAFQSNSPLRAEPNWPSPEVRALTKRACFDCHSNETVWPLYAKIAPSSWLVTSDVLRGRRKLNFSDWRAHNEQEEIAEVIQKGEMPPRIYTALHPEAILSRAEQQVLINAFQSRSIAPLSDSEQRSESITLPDAEHISVKRATQIAQAYHEQSEVREVKLEKERGVVAYEVKFTDGSEVYIAARTGQVVYAKIAAKQDEDK